jgi:hypothetical protein
MIDVDELLKRNNVSREDLERVKQLRREIEKLGFNTQPSYSLDMATRGRPNARELTDSRRASGFALNAPAIPVDPNRS